MISKGSSDISMEFGMVKNNDEIHTDDENEDMAIFDMSKPRYEFLLEIEIIIHCHGKFRAILFH